jgi:hypothetical protein
MYWQQLVTAPVMNHLNSIHTLTPYLFKINFHTAFTYKFPPGSIKLRLTTLIMFVEEHKLLIFLLCNYRKILSHNPSICYQINK